MNNKFKAAIIICIVILAVLVSGPLFNKPSELDKPIYVTFNGIENETCYAAPFCYDVNYEYSDYYNQMERQNLLVNGFAYNYVQECDDPSVFNAFANYTDFSMLTFMYAVYDVSDGEQILMPYNTPDVFKIVLYYPESNRFVTTRVAQKFADINRFVANYDLDNDIFQMHRIFFIPKDFIAFALQFIISIAAIILLGRSFDYRKKEELKVITFASVISLLVLNILTLLIRVFVGLETILYSYIALSLLSFIIQCSIYSKRLAFDDDVIDKERPIVFAFSSNAVAFGICVIIIRLLFG